MKDMREEYKDKVNLQTKQIKPQDQIILHQKFKINLKFCLKNKLIGNNKIFY